jgi:UDP-N-acetylglucosamine:LPS N-acetylglucosamine transferase
VARALGRQAPGSVEPCIVDLFALERPTLPDRLTRLYGPVIRHAPWFYGWVFHLVNRRPIYRVLVTQARRTLLPKVRRLLLAERPDAIVSTHPLCNRVTLDALADVGRAVPYVAVVTELVTVHRSWVEPEIGCYTTATAEADGAVLGFGAPPGRVRRTGLPIDERFGRVREACSEIRRGLGLDPERLTLLVVGGGEGLGVDRWVRAIDGCGVDAQIVAVCGRNRPLAERLRRAPAALERRVLGFVDTMPELMHAADIVFTKGGPQSIVEAMASGRPVVVTGRLPGQEEGNPEFVEAHGIGVDGRSVTKALTALRRLADDASERAEIGARARALAMPDAADGVAQAVLDLIGRPPNRQPA